MDHHEAQHGQPYRKLALMTALSFVSMYILMYAMVDQFANVVPNLNQFYMAALMTAPMVAIELALMGAMYPSKRTNLSLLAAAAIVLVGAFGLIRTQGAIGDREFLRSMIPHHAGAVLMCEHAQITDADIRTLCASIVTSQREEIAQMKALLARQ
ncbi:MAG TPA: DUF305 domain-containing protein [Caulobacterales bacterium]|nr:DUF305 domain-containing protein [Caulobacterales bacterium]